MTWLTENWFWILTFITFIAMHMFGHGGHGSHGRGNRDRSADGKEADAVQGSAGDAKSGGHQH